MADRTNKEFFTQKLLHWNTTSNIRQMPWKGENDPYKIWLSEIILQQTRVEQGWDYYNRFIKSFPTIEKLAKAPEEKVFKLWEGLGYYTRCKNLIATARFITKEKNGKFPDTYEEILALKGVGPYTAAAIASFAFNLPHAVVDGNVFRVLARFFAIDTAIDSASGKKIFTALAEQLLEKTKPGIYNQAIMDLGAVVCKPKNPLCKACPLQNKCEANLQGLIGILPVKTGKLIKKDRWLYYFLVEFEDKIFVRKRGTKDIWENLYEFILEETDKKLSIKKIKEIALFKNPAGKSKTELIDISKIYVQQLTHQTIRGRFIYTKTAHAPMLKNYKAVSLKELNKLPFPKFINTYLGENNLGRLKR